MDKGTILSLSGHGTLSQNFNMPEPPIDGPAMDKPLGNPNMIKPEAASMDRGALPTNESVPPLATLHTWDGQKIDLRRPGYASLNEIIPPLGPLQMDKGMPPITDPSGQPGGNGQKIIDLERPRYVSFDDKPTGGTTPPAQKMEIGIV